MKYLCEGMPVKIGVIMGSQLVEPYSVQVKIASIYLK